MSGPSLNAPQFSAGADGIHMSDPSFNAPQFSAPSMSGPQMSGPQFNASVPSFQPGMPQMPQAGMPLGAPAAASNKMIFIVLGVLLVIAIVVVVVFAMKK
jgi:hypothetical protein